VTARDSRPQPDCTRRAALVTWAAGLASIGRPARAQPRPRPYVIAQLHSSPEAYRDRWQAPFEEGMRALGYVEGRDVVYERRFSGGVEARLPGLVAELVALKPDVITAANNREIAAVKAVTSTIPIVMINAQDPVGAGFVASLARPGRNITGLSAGAGLGLPSKRLSLLKEVIPGLERVAVLRETGTRSPMLTAELEESARQLGLVLDVVLVRTPEDMRRALSEIAALRPAALLLDGAPLISASIREIAEFTVRNRIAGIWAIREFVQAGMLLSYGTDPAENYRRAAHYIDRILKGASPADLPIEQPTRFRLAINLKTARTLGIVMPKALLARADEVIE
jgi:putative ABC transport system substrate-binding protein